MTESERTVFEQALNMAWKSYVDRGAATFDALEENTQELAFAKGFKAGCEQGCKDTIDKACEWLKDNFANANKLLICYIGNSDMDVMVKHFKQYMEESND